MAFEKRVYKVDKKYWCWQLRQAGNRHCSGEACSRADAEEQIANKVAYWRESDRLEHLRETTPWEPV